MDHTEFLARYREAQEARRRRVLQWPDLVAQLRERPLRMANPGQWSGYLPPAIWQDKLNDSPEYHALVAICTEAKRREDQGQEPPT